MNNFIQRNGQPFQYYFCGCYLNRNQFYCN